MMKDKYVNDYHKLGSYSVLSTPRQKASTILTIFSLVVFLCIDLIYCCVIHMHSYVTFVVHDFPGERPMRIPSFQDPLKVYEL